MIKLKLLLCLPLAIVFSAVSGQSAKPKFSSKEVREDLAYLRSSLEDTHYNLFAYTSQQAFDENYQGLLNTLGTDSLGSLAAINLFQKVISKANTGHAEIDFPVQDYIYYAQNGGTVFPLEVAMEEAGALVRRNFSGNEGIPVGAKLLQINGQEIEKITDGIYPQLSAERIYFKNAKLEFWSFPRLYWQVFGQQSHFDVVLEVEGKTMQARIEAIPVMAYEGSRKGELLNAERSFKWLSSSIPYLNPGAFSGDAETGEATYRNFIDSVFVAVQQRKSKLLLLDLRNNAGGHNAYSDYLISYFADKPFKWHSSFRIKTSKLLKEQTRLHQDTTDLYFKTILAKPNGTAYTYAYEPYPPQEKKKRFKGQVYVLVNRQTYSMAAVAAALMQDYGFATVAGEETGDLPTLYASQFSYTLPHTGVVVKVPKGYMVRPNGSEKLAGVVPDIRIKDHLLDEEDEILAGLLKQVQQPLKKQSLKKK